ncbi:sodium-dependent proline transporter-like isoform X1 [Harpia harpyja]|uniref:sodium-dependent proline transporter-like isoform X1 n=1 Tax=Harpia harpyja TaxID=202280 RepID=UPI0022B215D1|nr:sodium-dependent proline transporter-like isoform X1 [Harpia harpyja]
MPGTGHLDMPGPPTPATPPEPTVNILQMEGPTTDPTSQPWPGPPPQPEIPAPSSRRETWTGKYKFLLSCLGYCVGLGSIWRFSYLCYRNGGGVFLIPYFIMLLGMGLPLFLMELSLGQYGAAGPITVWKCCPLLKGIGIAMLIVSSLVSFYYNVIIAWAFYYLGSSFQSPLPWSCDAPRNVYLCQRAGAGGDAQLRPRGPRRRAVAPRPVPASSLDPCLLLHAEGHPQFRQDGVLHGHLSLPGHPHPHHLGGHAGRLPRRHPLLPLLGLEQAAECPGVERRGLTNLLFPGHRVRRAGLHGLLQRVSQQRHPVSGAGARGARGVRAVGAAPGCSWGGAGWWWGGPSPTAHRDAPISILTSRAWGCDALPGRNTLVLAIGTCCTSCFAGFAIFSVLGHMAWRKQVPVGSVTDSGPGLMFVAYPEALSLLPISPLWSILFFLTLLTLGVDTLFGNIQAITTAILDEFPALHSRRKKVALLGALCTSFYLLGLLLVTQGGIFWLTLMDKYSTGFGLITVSLFMCLGIAFCYGVNQFCQDIMDMICQCPPWCRHMLGYFKACWTFFTPCLLLSVLICTCLHMHRVPLHHGTYEYPTWGTSLSICMGVLTCLQVPLWAVVALCRESGTLSNRFQKAIQPLHSWRAAAGRNITGDVIAWRSPSP